MSTYAVIENGKVANIVLADAPLADNWVASDVASIGWDYDGASFTPPAPSTITPEEVRVERNRLLAASDWTQLADAPVDQAAWAAYRQALRDVPQQAGFPDNVVWPVKPE
jgi:hypothetical protein